MKRRSYTFSNDILTIFFLIWMSLEIYKKNLVKRKEAVMRFTVTFSILTIFFILQRWTSYGVIPYDQKWDRIEFHQFTAAASFMLVSIGFWTYYKRDCMKKSWARREAHLLMQEREAAGLPYVDRNFINPAKLELPTDEELEGYPIII